MTTYTTPGGQYSKLYREALSAPHLMIAGATGSGKSVIVNGLIYTALCYSFPSDGENGARFILIDNGKGTEMIDYKDLPHTLRYAFTMDEAVSALEYALAIAKSRFQDMRRRHLKTYDGGHVYVFIDEFASLILNGKRRISPLVQDIAQLGRAAKVHIILCTQCPLAKVIPTEIKVNFDYRFALRTATRQHSRNIMDTTGCELLPQYGQGYFVTPHGTTLYNIPMYTDEQIAERVKWWTDQKPTVLPRKSILSRLFCK